jgi:hypothetical protein
MNVSQGFNGFLNTGYNRYTQKSKLIKKIQIPSEMTQKIHSMVNDIVNNRPAIEEFITSVIINS